MANDNHIIRTGNPVKVSFRKTSGSGTTTHTTLNKDSNGTVVVYESGTVNYTDGLEVRIIPGGVISEIKFTKAEAALPRIVSG